MKMAIRDLKMVVENVNIRGAELRTSKNGNSQYLIVRFEDETGRAQELIDRDLERQEFYKRDTQGNLVVNVDIGKFANLAIVDFKINKQ